MYLQPTYSTPATYAAYLAVWGPVYFRGRPLKFPLAARKAAAAAAESTTVEPWKVMAPINYVPTSVRLLPPFHACQQSHQWLILPPSSPPGL